MKRDKTVIYPVYRSEIWKLTKKEGNKLIAFERKIIRKIYASA